MSEPQKRRIAPQREESDAEFLLRIVAGDSSALGLLYDRHYVAVLHFAQRALRATGEAEDIAQETFLTVLSAASSYDGRPSCRPWLFGITARLILRRGRRAARLSRFLTRLISQPTEPAHASPHEALVRSEAQETLALALDKLSDEKRVVLIMAEVEGLSGEEIARGLGIPVGTVWTRLHHARNALRKRLARSQP